MAELITNNGNGRKRLSTRIDLTPMVDLGFLLITFFIYTTTMVQVATMEVIMPDETPSPLPPPEVPHHVAMKVFLDKNHKMYYLTGYDAMNNNVLAIKTADFNGENSIRKALIKHQEDIRTAVNNHLPGTHANDKPFLFIKAGYNTQYADLVDMLDEMTIVGISDYALLDLDKQEEDMIAKL
jgi:biopolymer transport protein ExbD